MWWFSTIQTLLHWYSFDYFSGSPHYYFRICPLPRSKEPAQAEIFVIRAWMNILSWWMRRTAQKPDTFIVDVLTPVCDQTNQSWLDSVPLHFLSLSTMGYTVFENHPKKVSFCNIASVDANCHFWRKNSKIRKKGFFFKMRHFWWFSNTVCYQPCFCISFLPFSIIDFYESLLDIFLFLHNKETGEETQNFYKTLCPVPLLLYIRT